MASAMVYITSPTASSNFSAGVSSPITWQDDGKQPTPKDIGPSKVGLYVGNVNQQVLVQTISTNTDVSQASSIDFTPEAGAGPDSDQYFIRFDSLSLKQNGTNFPVQAFSHKFALNKMTGSFNASVSSIIAGQSTAPFASQTSSGSSSQTSSPVLTGSGASKTPTSTSTTTSATARPSSGAMGLKAGWAGIVFGAVVGVTMF